jgi:3-hydroxyacyl-CoA dehydrogenase/3a,7a,12a-trihydroxy-5b-cholest-24-enoyl-CoA hydratase
MDSSALKSNDIFILIKNYLASGDGKDTVKKVQGVFQVDVLDKKGGKLVKTWTIDMKNGNGSVSEGGNEKANATFIVSDDDFYQICTGKLNPQMAFIQGKMKIKGSMSMATKFTPDLFPKVTPENQAKYAKAKF